MIPITFEELCKITAEKYGYDEKELKEVVDMYFKYLHYMLTNLHDVRIGIKNLGTFKIRPKKIREEYVRYVRLAQLKQKRNGNAYFEILKELYNRIDILERAIKYTENDFKKYLKQLSKKIQYERNKKLAEGVDKSQLYYPGDLEQIFQQEGLLENDSDEEDGDM